MEKEKLKKIQIACLTVAMSLGVCFLTSCGGEKNSQNNILSGKETNINLNSAGSLPEKIGASKGNPYDNEITEEELERMEIGVKLMGQLRNKTGTEKPETEIETWDELVEKYPEFEKVKSWGEIQSEYSEIIETTPLFTIDGRWQIAHYSIYNAISFVDNTTSKSSPCGNVLIINNNLKPMLFNWPNPSNTNPLKSQIIQTILHLKGIEDSQNKKVKKRDWKNDKDVEIQLSNSGINMIKDSLNFYLWTLNEGDVIIQTRKFSIY